MTAGLSFSLKCEVVTRASVASMKETMLSERGRYFNSGSCPQSVGYLCMCDRREEEYGTLIRRRWFYKPLADGFEAARWPWIIGICWEQGHPVYPKAKRVWDRKVWIIKIPL